MSCDDLPKIIDRSNQHSESVEDVFAELNALNEVEDND